MVKKLNPELSIKIEYLKDRKRPSEIFEAMGLYIDAHRDLCQIFASSVDIALDFEFVLNDVKEGSIISKLSAFGSCLSNKVENVFYNAGMSLVRDLSNSASAESESDVEQLALAVEAELRKNIKGSIVPPHVDRQLLAYVLEKISIANGKILAGENVKFFTGQNSSVLNTEWSFKGDPGKMFSGQISKFDGGDKLFVVIQVNEGNSVWTFKSPKLKQKFSAKIKDRNWLGNYQNGLISAIGPLDMLDVELSYTICTPAEGKGKPEIRNATIKKIKDIHRNSDFQHAMELKQSGT